MKFTAENVSVFLSQYEKTWSEYQELCKKLKAPKKSKKIANLKLLLKEKKNFFISHQESIKTVWLQLSQTEEQVLQEIWKE